jgi:hypothetical protein
MINELRGTTSWTDTLDEMTYEEVLALWEQEYA